MYLGSFSNAMQKRLEAKPYGWLQALEQGFADLLSFASDFRRKEVGCEDFDKLCDAGKEVKGLLKKLGLNIVILWYNCSPILKDGGRKWRQWAMKKRDGLFPA